jgi:hypothetical protein
LEKFRGHKELSKEISGSASFGRLRTTWYANIKEMNFEGES